LELTWHVACLGMTVETLTPVYPILLVDDESQTLTAMRIALLSAGFNNLRTCSDSREVDALLSAETFSLMLLDLNMPYVSGHQIIHRAAALKNSPPIIVVTASSQVKDYAQGAAAGIVDYLVKPVDRDRLIGAVRKALSRPGSQKGKFARDYLVSDLITAGSESADSAAAEGIIELLDQARGEYRRLIGNLPIPYAVLEPDTLQVRYCNNAFHRFLGADSVTVARLTSFLGLLEVESRERTVRALREHGEIRDQELRGQTPAGRDFVIVGSFRQLQEDSYVEAGFVDVTSHKKLEQLLARTSKLDTVGRMAAGLAHDFNNTLTVVSGFADMIAQELGASETIGGYTKEIAVAVDKAKRMVQQLFNLGNSARKENVSVDLNRTIREMEPSLCQHLRKGQSLGLSLAAAQPDVDISVDQIDHVVRNLVLNARDAMPLGGTITIATRTENEGAAHGSARVVLEIRDTGIGMDLATRTRIFEPFFTTKPKDEGTGLGLSMVQLIIEAAGGNIRVDSEPGKGTTFQIRLPTAAGATTQAR